MRTLAQRCAQAARETADKISDSAVKSEQGVEISAKMGSNLGAIVERIRKLDEMIAGIAQASHEQSEGIAQLNNTVAGMDRITQSNASLAEQSAASSEELKAQAGQVQRAVGELMAMVGGVQTAAAEDHPIERPVTLHQRRPALASEMSFASPSKNGSNGHKPSRNGKNGTNGTHSRNGHSMPRVPTDEHTSSEGNFVDEA